MSYQPKILRYIQINYLLETIINLIMSSVIFNQILKTKDHSYMKVKKSDLAVNWTLIQKIYKLLKKKNQKIITL